MTRNRLFVGNLAFETTAADLGKMFEEIGDVENATIIAQDGRSKGFGFVTMLDEETAQRALNALNRKDLHGRQINVEIAKPPAPRPNRDDNRYNDGGFGGRGGNFPPRRDYGPRAEGGLSKTRIHLGGLPYQLTEDELRQAFTGYGIKDVVIVRRGDGSPAGFGFIEFDNEADQRRAVDQKKEFQLKGRHVIVEAAQERTGRKF